MDLTLKRLLEQAEFAQSRKGYDQSQVDDFLDRAVAMATKVEARLTQAIEQAKRASGPAGPTVAEIEAEVQRRVEKQLAGGLTAPASPSEDESAEAVRRTIVLAQRTADAAVREAREEAAELLAEAKDRAATLDADTGAAAASAKATLTDEVDRERRAAHKRLAAEIGELEGAREALRSDVTVLEHHLEGQRSQLGNAVAELQRLLDDPAGFRLASTPALLNPDLPGVVTPEVEEQPPTEIVGDADSGSSGAEDTPKPPEAVAGAGEGPSLSFGDVLHHPPGPPAPLDGGPPTAPVSVVDLRFPPNAKREPGPAAEAPAPRGAPKVSDGEEDPFLTELRKAMADDEPLGPRDHPDAGPGEPFAEGDDGRGWRFGKRR